MFSSYSKLSLMATLFLTVVQAQSHECDSILSQGIRNTYRDLQSSDFRNQFSNKYCNQNQQTQSSGNSTGVGVGYKVFSFDFDNSNSSSSSIRASNCGESNGLNSDQKYVNAMRDVADPRIVEAWQTCMSNTTGLQILGELNGSSIVVKYVFRSAGAVARTSLTTDVRVRGAHCEDPIRAGTIINTGGLVQLCTRNGSDEVTIIANSDFAPAMLFIPAPRQIKENAVARREPSPDELTRNFCANWKGPGVPVMCGGTYTSREITPLPGSVTPLPGAR